MGALIKKSEARSGRHSFETSNYPCRADSPHRRLSFEHLRHVSSAEVVANERLSVCLSRRLGLCRQLQHRRVLTFTQPGE